MMKRWLAAGALVAVLCSQVMGQGVPDSKREMGEDYRWMWDTTSIAAGDTVWIRFPDPDDGSNAIPHPDSVALTDRDFITTARGSETVWWVQLIQYQANIEIYWQIFSPCIPAESMIVQTNEEVPFFTYGGCPIDSLWVTGDAFATSLIGVFATDGK